MTAMPPLRDILNNTPADAIDVDFNFNTVEAHVGSELINRDGSVAMTGPLSLPGPPTAPQHAATKAYVDSPNVIPLGTIWEFAGAAAPAGWALCDGTSKSTTDPAYAGLFAVIGYAYGGAGANFNLPDHRGRFPVGKGTAAPFTALNAPGGSKDAVSIDHGHTQSAHSHGGSSVGNTDTNHLHDLQNHSHDSNVRRGYDLNTANLGGGAGPGSSNAIYPNQGNATLYFTTRETAITKDTIDGPNHQLTAGPNPNNTGWMDRTNVHAHPLTIGSEAPAIQRDGVAGTDKNLPPYLVVNFIIRIG